MARFNNPSLVWLRLEDALGNLQKFEKLLKTALYLPCFPRKNTHTKVLCC